MTPRKLAVVTAGLSKPSSTRLLADRLTAAARHALADEGVDVAVKVVELRDHAHDLANNLVTGLPTGGLKQALGTVTDADGLIAVTPIFTASYSGLFKSFFDVLEPDALQGIPVLIGATGGTPRHSLALDHAVRPLFAYLRAVVAPTAVYAASEDWGSNGSQGALSERIGRAAEELASLMAGHSRARSADPYDNPVPFEKLLAVTQRVDAA
ncbi:MAG: FMN reductase [Thermocrispum sp.]